MFFEGSEKKVEVVVSSTEFGSLRDLGDEFWSLLVGHARAQILSKIQNEQMVAFLLSESSLFVWDNRFTLITCGVTTLIKSVDFFLKNYDSNGIQSIIFERKNEYMPDDQYSDFKSDIKLLGTHLEGQDFQFGNPNQRHLYLYHMNKPFQPCQTDMTLEVLMYDIQGKAKEVFSKNHQSREDLRGQMKIHKILEGFDVDDFAFDPFGYSLNAIRGNEYFTYHVTPQDQGSYVSFETNTQTENYENVVKDVVQLFHPRFFEVIVFRAGDAEDIKVEHYAKESVVTKELSCGYDIHYFQFHEPLTFNTFQ